MILTYASAPVEGQEGEAKEFLKPAALHLVCHADYAPHRLRPGVSSSQIPRGDLALRTGSLLKAARSTKYQFTLSLRLSRSHLVLNRVSSICNIACQRKCGRGLAGAT